MPKNYLRWVPGTLSGDNDWKRFLQEHKCRVKECSFRNILMHNDVRTNMDIQPTSALVCGASFVMAHKRVSRDPPPDSKGRLSPVIFVVAQTRIGTERYASRARTRRVNFSRAGEQSLEY